MLIKLVGKMLRKKLKLDSLVEKTVGIKDIVANVSTNVLDGQSLETQAAESVKTADTFLKLELELNDELKNLTFQSPVAYVYHPLDYAVKPHSVFVNKYLDGPKKLLFVGMNPGPWGMCQTGIPFGEVKTVKEWFKINENVYKPQKECPERKILGLSCPKTEISGQRIWGLMKNVCDTPENFFKNSFMYNYCPIAMMKSNGSNVTPSEIKGEVSNKLEEYCDKTLYQIIQVLEAEVIVAVGKYVEKRLLLLKKDKSLKVEILYLLHPSPRVANNQNWLIKAEERLKNLNLMTYLKPE